MKNNPIVNQNVNRCAWVNSDPLYMYYHDHEWGVPVYNDQLLFEYLILEGAQAGLNWLTILKKREHYRKAFDGFDPTKIATYDASRVVMLLMNEGIVRHRLKIESVITNARAFLKIQESLRSFSEYIWEFVDGNPAIIIGLA